MTDKMFLYRCSAICLCLLALSCCSVKEDRSGCPCLLRLDMSDAGAEAPVNEPEDIIDGENHLVASYDGSDRIRLADDFDGLVIDFTLGNHC